MKKDPKTWRDLVDEGKELEEAQRDFLTRLVPFAAKLFTEPQRPPRLALAAPLPLLQPAIASREAIEALQEIILRGTLKQLVMRGGWQERALGQLGEEKPTQGRFWTPQIWQKQAPPLHFTQDSIDLLIVAYNLFQISLLEKKYNALKDTSFAQKRRDEKSEKEGQEKKKILSKEEGLAEVQRWLALQFDALEAIEAKASGDRIVQWLLYDALSLHLPARFFERTAWFKNPLILIHFFSSDVVRDIPEKERVLELLKPSFLDLLPWLGIIWRDSWLREHLESTAHSGSEASEEAQEERSRKKKKAGGEKAGAVGVEGEKAGEKTGEMLYARRKSPLRYGDEAAFRRYFGGMTSIWGALFRFINKTERLDLLVPWLEVFAGWSQNKVLSRMWPQLLGLLRHNKRIAEQEELNSVLLQAMGLIEELEKIAAKVRSLHPMDREAPHRIFLQSYDQCAFSQVLQEYRACREVLRPSLS